MDSSTETKTTETSSDKTDGTEKNNDTESVDSTLDASQNEETSANTNGDSETGSKAENQATNDSQNKGNSSAGNNKTPQNDKTESSIGDNTTSPADKTEPSTGNNTTPPKGETESSPGDETIPPEETDSTKVLVAYFSCTGTTRPLAEYAADILNADIYEIKAQIPYTDADLAYYTGGRADKEQNDPSARPAISSSVQNMADYDIVFIGYPIWHGQAPRIISTFLESYDFSGKTIVPFCTSHSSGIGSSDTNLHSLAPNANWLSGKRFSAGTSKNTIKEWIDTLNLPTEKTRAVGAFNFETKTVLLNSGWTATVNCA